MGLDAGEVYVIAGARLDSSSFARANAAMKATKEASDSYQASMDRGAAAGKRLEAANARWAHAAVIGAKASAIGIGTVVAALGGAAVAAARFDASMRNVNSIAGLSEGGLKRLEAQVLRLSTAVGKSPTELADGLYSIVSSGFKAADALKILTAGAKAARAGLTDTATATDAITGVLNAYNLKASDSRKVSDLLFQTVNVGVENFTQLAGSLGKVLAPAKGLGVSLKDLLGAQAALTLQHNSADEAATQLGMVMAALTKPSKGLAKELKDLGYESGQAAVAHLGFKGVLDQLGKAAHGNQALLASWFGNIRAFRGVNGLEGTTHGVELFSRSVKAMDDATKGAGVTQKVYNEQQKSTAAQFDHLRASIDVAAVTIGTALLPQINAGIQALTHWLAAAQKSGELSAWAHTIAADVSGIVTFLHSLGPEASAAFHVVAATIQAAIPFAKGLLEALQAVEPEMVAVAHAAAGLASALGPAPILGAVAAYLALGRATNTAQVGAGKFASVMKAGNVAIAGSVAGGLTSSRNITRIGSEAVKSSSKVSIFTKGLISTIGTPTLLTIGAAGIVGSILLITSNLKSMEQAAREAGDAFVQLENARLAKRGAVLDVKVARRGLSKALETSGSAAVAVQRAQSDVFAAQASGDPKAAIAAAKKLDAAYGHLRDTSLAAAQARQRLAEDNAILAQKDGELTKSGERLASTFKNVSDAALLAGAKTQQFGKAGGTTTFAPLATQLDNVAAKFEHGVAVADGSTAADRRKAAAVGDLIRQMTRLPDKQTTRILVDDLKSNASIAKTRRDLLAVGALKPTPKIDANTAFIGGKLDALNTTLKGFAQPHPVNITAPNAPTIAGYLDGINTRILHLTSKPFTVNVQYATSGSTTPTGPPFKKKAMGGYADKPEFGIWGEDGPEYTIPVGPKHRASGMALWLQAGKALGVPGFAKGKKPGKTPAPVPKALGYDPAALDSQMQADKTRVDHARAFRDTLSGRIATDVHHHDALEKQKTTAERGTSSKNKKVAAAAVARVASIEAELKRTQAKIDGERKAHKRQVDDVIPAEIKRYEAATRAAKIGNDHAKQITLWQNRADADATEMATASTQWDAADRKKDPAGKTRAYEAWDAARLKRVGDLGHIKDLLKEVMSVVGKTAYGATITGQLSGIIGDIVTAQDETAAPGYVDPTAQAPSTSLDDYLFPEERAALAQAAYEEAVAANTADTADDVTAASHEVGAAQWIVGRLTQDGAPIDILTQAQQLLSSANSNLQSAVQGSGSSGSGGVTADQQAILTQAQTQRDAAQANADSAAKALQVFQGSLDLILGGGAGGGGDTIINVGVKALTADSSSVQRKVGYEVVKAMGAQPYVQTTTGYYGG
jgi:TP901 family phage tail tape measure protein